jgi:hypothetical protein
LETPGIAGNDLTVFLCIRIMRVMTGLWEEEQQRGRARQKTNSKSAVALCTAAVEDCLVMVAHQQLDEPAGTYILATINSIHGMPLQLVTCVLLTSAL